MKKFLAVTFLLTATLLLLVPSIGLSRGFSVFRQRAVVFRRAPLRTLVANLRARRLERLVARQSRFVVAEPVVVQKQVVVDPVVVQRQFVVQKQAVVVEPFVSSVQLLVVPQRRLLLNQVNTFTTVPTNTAVNIVEEAPVVKQKVIQQRVVRQRALLCGH